MPKGGKPLGDDPATGLTVFAKSGRFGPYVQLGELDDGADGKPEAARSSPTMDPYTVTLDEALQLLSLPRVVGHRPGRRRDRAPRTASSGPTSTRAPTAAASPTEQSCSPSPSTTRCASSPSPSARGRAAPKPPLAELGADPCRGKPMVVKDGRFGPYVTDGETNASLRKGDEPETISDERAAELLQDRRDAVANGEVGKRPAKKAATQGHQEAGGQEGGHDAHGEEGRQPQGGQEDRPKPGDTVCLDRRSGAAGRGTRPGACAGPMVI